VRVNTQLHGVFKLWAAQKANGFLFSLGT